MKLDDLEAVMLELAAGIRDAHVEVGRSGRPRNVFLKLTSLTDPGTFAIISATGSGAYELEVSSGFYAGLADDLASDAADVLYYLESYVRAARAYLEGNWSIRTSKVLRIQTLRIQKEGVSLNLARLRRWSYSGRGPRF